MEEKKGEKRIDIIKKVALSRFINHGYEGTSIRDICEVVGVKQPTLYFYFKSKDILYMSLVRQYVKEYTDLYLEILDETTDNSFDAKEKLYQVFYVTIKYYILNPENFKFVILVRDSSPENLKEEVREEFYLLESTLTELITILYNELKEDIIAESAEELIMFLYRCVRGYLLELIQLNKNPTEEDIKNVWQRFTNGIF